jgi:hypothetical protein
MISTLVEIHELAGWGFDLEGDRSMVSTESLDEVIRTAVSFLSNRAPHIPTSPCLDPSSSQLRTLLRDRASVVARSGEFEGFNWKLAIVDLKQLIAFQRRIGFEQGKSVGIPDPEDIESLVNLALPGRLMSDRASSPFMEVAIYRGRWFLRDGYHRSYRLLGNGIRYVPAVVLEVHTSCQLGAAGHRFFREDVLFSARPPMVDDFLNENLTLRYSRPEAPSPVIACERYQEVQ